MNVVCIGSGNVATHMASALVSSGAKLIQVWSKSLANAAILAEKLNASAVTLLSELDKSADLYIIAVKDDAIQEVAEALSGIQGLVVHTSGATDVNVLSSLANFGVLYPLQTFSRTKPLDFKDVPLCLEANNTETLGRLKSIANQLTPLIYEVNSDKRKILHLAAVFVCNFVNHLYELGGKVLENSQLDFEMLRPLIKETAIKVQDDLPINVQTGPAVRDDKQTISRHLELLDEMPEMKEIYQTLSDSIKKSHY